MAIDDRDCNANLKTDFIVTWEDGVEYAGTFYLCPKRHRDGSASLAQHINDHLDHVLDSEWYDTDSKLHAQDLLDEYQIG